MCVCEMEETFPGGRINGEKINLSEVEIMKNILKSIGYILFYIVFQIIIVSIVSVIVGASSESKEQMQLFINNNMMVLALISNILTIVVLVLISIIRKRNLFKELNIKKVRFKEYIFPCIMAFTCSMAFALLTYHLSFENALMIQTGVTYYSGIMPYLGIILQIVTLLVVAPITEEIICRGLILTTLQKEYRKAVAVTLSALLFGVLHLMAGGTVLVLGSFIMGIILGIICVKTKSLLPAIFAHIFANIPDFVIGLLPKLSNPSRYGLLIICALVFIAATYKFIKKDDGNTLLA